MPARPPRAVPGGGAAARPAARVPRARGSGGKAGPEADLLAASARAVATAARPREAFAAVLAAERVGLAPAGAALVRAEGGRLVLLAVDGLRLSPEELDARELTGGGYVSYPLLLERWLEGALLTASPEVAGSALRSARLARAAGATGMSQAPSGALVWGVLGAAAEAMVAVDAAGRI